MLKFYNIAASKLAPAFALSYNNGGMCSSPSAFTLFKASIHSPVSFANKSHPRTTYTRKQKLSPDNISLESTNLEDALDLFNSMIRMHPLPGVVRFNQLLGKILRMKHYSNVISLYKEMSLLGIVPDLYTLSILINCFSHLSHMSSGLSVLGKLIKFGYEPDTVTMNTLMKGFFIEGKAAEATKCFSKMTEAGCVPDMVYIAHKLTMGDTNSAIDLLEKMEQEFGKPSVVVYNTVIDSLCKDGLFVDALNIFSEIIRQGIVPNIVTLTTQLAPAFALSYNNGGMCSSPSAFTLFKASIHSPVSFANKSHPRTTYTRKQKLSPDNISLESTNLEDALDLFNSMIRMHPLPGVVRFNQLLGKILRMKHYSNVISLYKQMGLLGIVPDLYTLSILSNCFSHLSHMSSGLSVLGKLIKFGYEPDTVTMNTLMKGFFIEGKAAEATKCFIKMTEAGCVPDMVYIAHKLTMGDTNSAIDLLEKMEQEFGKPSVVVYNTVIDSLCKDGLFVDALNIFFEMIHQGIVPNIVTYNSLIHGACKIGQWKEARRLLKEMTGQNIKMIDNGIFPNIVTYTSLIHLSCIIRQWKDATRLLNEMVVPKITPNVQEVMVEEAWGVVEIMVHKGIKPTVVTFNSLLDGYCLRGKINKRIGEALRLFQELCSKGLNPGVVTYSTLIGGLCKVGRTQAAHIVKLITFYWMDCKNGKLEEAMALFQEMEEKKLHLDLVNYNIFIGGMCKAGNVAAAKKLFCLVGEALNLHQEMNEKSCFLDSCTYNLLIRGLVYNNEISRAVQLADEMVKKGFSVDSSTLTLFFDLVSKVDPSLKPLAQKFV
ncbi:hypothetical protein UlMin_006690 [Ulmus minor]